MNGHDIVWSQPPSLLASAAARLLTAPRAAMQRPAILRFQHDGFMQEFMDLVNTAPERLREYEVRRETWRGFTPAPIVEPPRPPSLVRQRLGLLAQRGPLSAAAAAAVGAAVGAAPGLSGAPLKLYQPAHQRHYLVACSLVCRVVGLPDRAIDAGRGEQVGCVIRRLLPRAGQSTAPVHTWDEHAWVARPQGYAWQPVGSDPLAALEGEERLPLFAVQFAEGERRRRRLFAGVIPVGKRDAYLGAPKATAGTTSAAGVTPRTARKVLLRKEVIEPWKSLVRRALGVQSAFTISTSDGYELPSDAQKLRRLRSEREQIQTASWFILLDLAKYLSTYVTPVWRAVLDPAHRQLSIPESALFDALADAHISDEQRETIRRDGEIGPIGSELYTAARVPSTLLEALAQYGTAGIDTVKATLERQLERVDQPYVRNDATSRALWPDFLFPLVDPAAPSDAPLPPVTAASALDAEERSELTLDAAATGLLQRLDTLTLLILRALGNDATPPPEPAVPAAAIAPVDAFEGWFVIRCLFERPGCEPLHNEIISEPTEPFQMAGFFDPDAPARPIRIGLPIDTTPGGLRKFDKNTAFVISDTLCGQLGRIRGLTLGDLVLSVLPWPFHKDLPSFEMEGAPCKTGDGLSLGMICSLSIPIITLCALILLIIMVSLFDFIFKWLPYFVICFPLPGLKAKKGV
jgi:hypothetical protein